MEEDIEVVGFAENGEKGIGVCETANPDVILMNIHMPVMDGVTATGQIKDRWPDRKVVMLTTFQDADMVAKALNAGAEGDVLKDIDPKNLANVIRLVHAGETMIPQAIAKQLFQKLSAQVEPASNSSTPSAIWSKEYGISDQELEVLQCLADGLKNRDIAALSEGSIRNYISSIYSKLNVENRASAVKKFHREE